MCLHFAILSYSEKLWNVFKNSIRKMWSVCAKIALFEKIFRCVLGQDTLLSQYLSPPGELLGKPNKLQGSDLQWTSILSRGSRNTSSRFMLQKPGWAVAAMSQPWLQGFTIRYTVTLILSAWCFWEQITNFWSFILKF